MRSVSLFLVMALAVSVFVLVGCQPAGEPETEAPVAAMTDEELVEQSVAEFTAAWNGGDAAAIAAFWAEDGDMMVPTTGELLTGRASLESYYQENFEGVYKGSTISITPTSIRRLQPDVMVVNGSYEISGIMDAEGEEMPTVKGQYTHVSVQKDDTWLIVSHRPMIPLQAPGTT